MPDLSLLFLSTPVAPLGTGITGGVKLTLFNLVQYLEQQGCRIDIVAPEDSIFEQANLIQLPGNTEPPAQDQPRHFKAGSTDQSFLTRMCTYAKTNQYQYDLILSFAYDWLPIYLTPSFDTPLAHFISMSSINDAVDYEISAVSRQFPQRFACYTKIQAETFPNPEVLSPLGFGIDIQQYEFCDEPEDYLVWIGRLSPEKGLEDAVQVADESHIPLKIIGKLEHKEYWDDVRSRYPDAPIEYMGFLHTHNMQNVVRKARAMLMTPHWTEAFGIVVIEALACGVPVISYDRGGPSEILDHKKTGLLTPPESVDGLLDAIEDIHIIDRQLCRKEAEKRFSLNEWGHRFENWIHNILE